MLETSQKNTYFPRCLIKGKQDYDSQSHFLEKLAQRQSINPQFSEIRIKIEPLLDILHELLRQIKRTC